jgi:hypothetical protein
LLGCHHLNLSPALLISQYTDMKLSTLFAILPIITIGAQAAPSPVAGGMLTQRRLVDGLLGGNKSTSWILTEPWVQLDRVISS